MAPHLRERQSSYLSPVLLWCQKLGLFADRRPVRSLIGFQQPFIFILSAKILKVYARLDFRGNTFLALNVAMDFAI
ncbi:MULTISPECIES: hypothetical protein [Bartonella]|uniref:hypothetical protein n=1 Tax=Bartonella TaxID=773 RepID=UPI0023611EFE|nr:MULTISPECIES: hypothetical protein [Bartonella]